MSDNSDAERMKLAIRVGDRVRLASESGLYAALWLLDTEALEDLLQALCVAAGAKLGACGEPPWVCGHCGLVGRHCSVCSGFLEVPA